MEQPKHYQFSYTRNLSTEELASGEVTIKLDPYRICDVYNIGGGAREQIIKKGLRWDTKGDSEEKVITEIMQACQRRLDMLKEDATPKCTIGTQGFLKPEDVNNLRVSAAVTNEFYPGDEEK